MKKIDLFFSYKSHAYFLFKPLLFKIYDLGKKWSLEYFETIYKRLGTQHNSKDGKAFDYYFFESETGKYGREVVEEFLGKGIFEKSEGAVIYDGEKHGLHKRVFITKEGYPTYEGKDIALAFAQFADFAFDTNIHVVASEQRGYFEVVFDALNQIDPKFKSREYHLSMGLILQSMIALV